MQLSIVVNSNYSTVVVTTNSDNSNNSSNNGTLPLLKVLLTATFVAVALMAPERPLEWRGIVLPSDEQRKKDKAHSFQKKGLSSARVGSWDVWKKDFKLTHMVSISRMEGFFLCSIAPSLHALSIRTTLGWYACKLCLLADSYTFLHLGCIQVCYQTDLLKVAGLGCISFFKKEGRELLNLFTSQKNCTLAVKDKVHHWDPQCASIRCLPPGI